MRALLLAVLLSRALTAQEPQMGSRTSVRDGSVTKQLVEYWKDRMGLAERRKAACLWGHWEADTMFVIDSLSKPSKRCAFPKYQGIIAFMELDIHDTREAWVARWQLIIADHPGCLFLGAVVGLTRDRRPILWGYQRRYESPAGIAPEALK